MEINQQKVFLSFCTREQLPQRNELAAILQSAGFEVIQEVNEEGEKIISSVQQQLAVADCSVHILFNTYGSLVDSDISMAQFQFNQAMKQLTLNPDFRMFIWLPSNTDITTVELPQMNFITQVRKSIVRNMVLSNAKTAIRLVDDIRSQMKVVEQVDFNLSSTEIFFVSNHLDEFEAKDIIDMLTDIVPVENLNIIQDNDIDYSEICRQQIPKSKLAVIYFKATADWALPFAQQVWKKIGGATSHTPILLIGDDDPTSNINVKLKAPKVISLIVSGQLIPLEIKVQYDKVMETSVL